MKTHRIIILAAVISTCGFSISQAQPTAGAKAAPSKTESAWQAFQSANRIGSVGDRSPADPADLASYEQPIQRLLCISQSLREIDLSGVDPILARHIKECADAHRGMAAALREARQSLVPALIGLQSELATTERGQIIACEACLDLEHTAPGEGLIQLAARLQNDPALAAESHFLPKQCRIISAQAEAFDHAEKRLRAAYAAHEQVAMQLGVKHGSEFSAGNRHTTLWTW